MCDRGVDYDPALCIMNSYINYVERSEKCMAKMTVITERCKGCGLCTAACPKQIVALQKEKRNKKGYFYAECTDQSACIGCAMCAMMCPDCAITVEK